MHPKSLRNIAFFLVALFLFACASKKDDGHEHPAHGEAGNVWGEMDDFHMIMAETFHPYKDSSNLEPAKARAGELMAAADHWASATLPPKVNNDEIKSKLVKLKREAALLAESVKSADDNVIASQLTTLHDTFHEIQEAWYGRH